VLIAVKKSVRSGKNNCVKKSNSAMKKTCVSRKSFLIKQLLWKMKIKILEEPLIAPIHNMDPTISNIIHSTIVNSISSPKELRLTTPPTKAVGDQHRPHLNTLLEERSGFNNLKPMPITRPSSNLMNIYNKSSKKK